MGINLSKLKDVKQFELNTSSLKGNVLQNMKSNAIEITGGWLGFGIMFIIFFFLIWHYYRKDKLQTYDILRSGLFASGFTFILGLVMISFGFIGSYRFVAWYGLIFMILLVGIVEFKRKGY